MRLLLVAAPLLLLALVPTGSALLGGACVDANASTAAGFAWVPSCLRIQSGDAVTFGNADEVPHNARSSQDDAGVLRLAAPICFATPSFDKGGTAMVRFTHDSTTVRASLREADGSWGPAADCTLARHPASLGGDEAVIPFECAIHPSMTGRIVVTALAMG